MLRVMGTSLKCQNTGVWRTKRAFCAAKPRRRLGKIGYGYFSQSLQCLIQKGTNSNQDIVLGISKTYFWRSQIEKEGTSSFWYFNVFSIVGVDPVESGDSAE
jgi:hypothetical protein